MSSQERPGHSINDLQSALHHDAATDAKEKLTRNLQNHNLELRKSDIHGVGVFAITQLQKGTALGDYNRTPCPSTIDFTGEEISKLPNHVQNIVKSFILPSNNDVYSIPEHGLACTLGVTWYINSCQGTDKDANVEFGNKRDMSGFTEIITTRKIEKDEELLLPYSTEISRRGMTTIDNAGNCHELPEDVVPCCRVCQDDLPMNSSKEVVDIGCNCNNNKRMCQGCAVKWFTQHITMKFTQHKPDDINHDDIVNEWMPGVSVECELCKHVLSPDLCTLLLGKAAESKNASKALILINKRINAERGRDAPVAIQVSNVPGYTSVSPRHGKGGGKRGNVRGKTQRKKRPAYSNLGRGSRQVSKTQTNCPRVGCLGAEDTIWQQ